MDTDTNIDTVHVIFKTHLDLGFTDLAENVIRQYCEQYIPAAVTLAEQLAVEGDEVAFIWTTGSWLIHEFLKRADEAQTRRLEAAIDRGAIVWHGLPFTTHTELMDAELFEYGLSLAGELDRRFGKQTIAAKMTDVPGHTRAIIGHMARRGLVYLHIGVNPASKVPGVPDLFVWKGKDGAEIIVNYANDYGNLLQLEGFREAIVFSHTGDNHGPPSEDSIKQELARLAERFPNARIQASTMDAFARALLPLKDTLPVVHEEIGDTWIHGVASDPWKVARYRTLLRFRRRWLEEGRIGRETEAYRDLSNCLLLLAEHTWGMDEKKYLTDFKHYSLADFTAARQADAVAEDAVPDKYHYLGCFRMNSDESLPAPDLSSSAAGNRYAAFESSWREQRDYLAKALSALDPAMRQEAERAIADTEPVRSASGTQNEPLQLHTVYPLGRFHVAFASDGSIVRLEDNTGKQWASERHRLGVLLYEAFGVENYHTWFEQYVERLPETYVWADADFGKPGMELAEPRPRNELHRPRAASISVIRGEDGDRVRIMLFLPEEAVRKFGCPKEIVVNYHFYKEKDELACTLDWFDKQANRLPEAYWFSFSPRVDNPNLWKMDKLGEPVSPLEVVRNGNRNLHAVNQGVSYNGADGIAEIATWDAPLVAPGERRLLEFDNSFAKLNGGMHFLLYNNVWGTNFPMWYDEDSRFRFVVSLKSNAQIGAAKP
nr:DUF5054 domain-containing protein [Cohnella hashimotonis]